MSLSLVAAVAELVPLVSTLVVLVLVATVRR
jgi:hypothetical protein